MTDQWEKSSDLIPGLEKLFSNLDKLMHKFVELEKQRIERIMKTAQYMKENKENKEQKNDH